MTEELLLELMRMTVETIGLLSAPLLIGVTVIGVLVNIVQTITQIRDPSLAFIPKVIAAGVIMVVTAAWGLQTLRTFCEHMMAMVGRGVF